MALTSTPSRRQSCDRCHGQKLRCSRAGDDETAACIRCLRQGAQCVYSSSLPKGRPSMYRSAENATRNVSSPISPSAIRKAPSRARTASKSEVNVNTTPSTTAEITPPTTSETTDLDTTLAPYPSGTGMPPGFGTTPSFLPDPIPSKPPPSDSVVERTTDQEPVIQVPMEEPAPMWLDHDMDWSTNMLDLVGQQMDASFAFLETLPDMLPPNICSDANLEAGFLTTMKPPKDMAARRGSADARVLQLSQLSNRLSTLHRWSCNVAGYYQPAFPCSAPNQGCPLPLINDLAFNSVVSWLIHASADMNLFSCPEPKPDFVEPSSMDDTLHHVFSASHQFMETLRDLQSDDVNRMQNPPPHLIEMAFCTRTGPTPFIATQEIPLVTPQVLENPYSSIAERHLVIACHTLLLEIYVIVFGSLQRDIDHRHSHLDGDPVDQDQAAGATLLTDMRLVLVVQLCSYLLERQHQAVSSYLLPKSEAGWTTQVDLSNPSKFTAIQGVNTGPDSEVQRRLERLRESLRI